MLCYVAIQPAPIHADVTTLTQDQPLVTLEIRYHMPEAGEVFLVWGINGWAIAPEENRPPGTVVKDSVMHTPMACEDDTFVAQVRVSAGATMDYGFLITRTRSGAAVRVWEADGDQDYHTVATQDGTIEVQTMLTLTQDQASTSIPDVPLITLEIRYHVPEAGEVSLVWGIDSWNAVPEEVRPPGTVVKDAIMYTPMIRANNTFTVKLQVPAGATIDYAFQITKTRSGVPIEISDTNVAPKRDYHTIAVQGSVIDVQAPQSIVKQVAAGTLDADLPWLGLILLIGNCIVLGVVAERILEMRNDHSAQGTLLVLRHLATRERVQAGLLWGIALLSLALRLYAVGEWNIRYAESPERLSGDEIGYNNLALAILNGSSLNWPGRPPLYPLWLAMAHRLTHQSYSAVLYIQALLGTAVIPLSYSLGSRIFGRGAALIAAFLAATSFPLIHQPVRFLSEVLYTPVILVVVISIWDAIRKPTIARSCWAGLWTGLSAFVRPTLLLFPFFSIVMYIIILGKRRAVRCWTAYVLTTLLIVMPWIVRGYVRFQAWLPMATDNGWFWLGSPESYHLAHDDGYSYSEILTMLYHPVEPEPDPHSIEGNRYWTARALRSIAKEPLIYLKYSVEKIGFYWVGHPGADWGDTHAFNYALLRRWGYTPQNAVQILFARGMPILALLSSLILRHKWHRLLPIYAILIYCTLLHAAAHAEARLSDPLQPLLMILVGGAAVVLAEAALHRVKHQVSTSTDPERNVSVAADGIPAHDDEILGKEHRSHNPVLEFFTGTMPIVRRVSTATSSVAPSHVRRPTYLRDLLRELVVRDMKLRYKRSVLGIVWSLLNPLFQMLVFVFLSRRVLSLDIPNYPSFVFTGVLAWNWFQSTVVTMTSAITGNRELIRRPGFPVAILPVVTVTTNLIHFLLALPVPLLFLLLGGGRLTPALLALPLVIALQFLLILGLGYLAATANVTFRDTQHLLVVFFMLLFYLTPVFYDANAVPARYQILYRLNPMFHLITAYRAILIGGELPDFRALLPLAALVGVLLWLGHSVFQRASYHFVEEL